MLLKWEGCRYGFVMRQIEWMPNNGVWEMPEATDCRYERKTLS
jgi:hypothetical protein